jgi:hypothetical protein
MGGGISPESADRHALFARIGGDPAHHLGLVQAKRQAPLPQPSAYRLAKLCPLTLTEKAFHRRTPHFPVETHE